MPTRAGKRRELTTRVTSCVAFSLGTIGSILMIVSAGCVDAATAPPVEMLHCTLLSGRPNTARVSCVVCRCRQLSDMPATYLCKQQGYAASDCTSLNQTMFSLSSTPPCCLGKPNATVAWSRDPFVDMLQAAVLLSCKDRASSDRAQIQWANPDKSFGAEDLDAYEMLALQACEREKTLSKFYFLWQPGVIAAIAVIMSAGAHASGVSWIAAIGNMVGTANIAVISSAVSIAQSLDTQTGVACAGLSPSLVKNGRYMDTFSCYDVTIGGVWAVDPGYAFLQVATRNYYSAAVLCLISAAIYAGLVAAKLTRRADQRSKRMMREVVRDRAWFDEDRA